MRHIYQGVFKDGNGAVVTSGNITVYLAGTTTLATIYTAETGGSADSDSIVTSDSTNGTFSFYVDPLDYELSQKFKIILSKTDFTSTTYDDIDIFPNLIYRYIADPDETDQGLAGNGNSVKAIVDSIGSTNESTYFPASATSYTFSNDETISANITLVVPQGADISIDNGVTLTINGQISAGAYQIFSGDGTVVINSGVINAAWFGAKGDNSNDDTAELQAALENLEKTAISGYNMGKVLEIPAGVYKITDELLLDEYIQQAKIVGLGRVQFLWAGATDNTKAVVRITASSGKTIDHLTWENIDINADDKAGYCIRAEGSTGGTYSVKNCVFKNSFFESATVANFLGGDDTEPADYDTDFSQNFFDHCIFYNAPINVLLNGTNVYNNDFKSCSFGSNQAAAVNQHLRLVLAGATNIVESQFTALTGTDSTFPDATTCIYITGAGGLMVRNIYSEEARIISADNIQRVQDMITLDGVYVNDTRTTAGGITMDGIYSAYFGTGRVVMSNCYLAGFDNPTWTSREVYASSSVTGLHLNNVVTGPNGIINNVACHEKTTIEGVKNGVFESLIPNWDFEFWATSTAAGTDDTLYYWYKVTSAGSTYTVEKDTTNNVFGTNTLMVDCTTKGTTNLMGVEGLINQKSADFVTVVIHGTVSVNTVVPEIRIDGASRLQGYKINSDLTFSAWGRYDSSGVAVAQTEVAIGMALNVANEGEQLYIDRVLVIPGMFPIGSAMGLQTAKPHKNVGLELHGSAAPATGTWQAGDKIWDTTPTKDGNNMVTGIFMCTVGGSPGTWETLYLSSVSPAT